MTDPAKATYYITTPIYYVNDRPHIGHAYTTTICDIAARFHRFLGRDVFFLTGTDEHGIKVERAAQAKGIDPQDLADANAAEFEKILGVLGMSNDDFIRTTQPRHVEQVKKIVTRLIESGDVYLGQYEGWYDEGQEEFIVENRAAEQDYRSAISGRPLVKMTEENYFFRLSAYQDRLQSLYDQQPGFVRPEARRNEMLARLRDGLRDVPISRTSFSWGIRIPGDDRHVMWVWLDALSNYITTIGLIDSAQCDDPARRRYWPADYHVIGKEILFFHALFWPAVLMALDLPQPRCIYAHSFWMSEGRKMSKSLGNFIDLQRISEYTETFSLDAWRWFMATQGPLGATDADFTHRKFVEVYNTDLANTFGNSVSRVTNMIVKYFDGVLPEPGDDRADGFDWPELVWQAVDETVRRIEHLELATGLQRAMALVRSVDGYIDATKPFALAGKPDQHDRLGAILYNCAEALRIASLLLWCAIPSKVGQFWRSLGLTIDPASGGLRGLAEWGGLKPGQVITKGPTLFPRHVQK